MFSYSIFDPFKFSYDTKKKKNYKFLKLSI